MSLIEKNLARRRAQEPQMPAEVRHPFFNINYKMSFSVFILA